MTTITTRIAGVSFTNDDGQSRQYLLRHVKAGDGVLLQRQWDNDYDPNAIAVLHAAGQIGFIPAKVAANMVRQHFHTAAVVKQVHGGSERAPTLGCEISITIGGTEANDRGNEGTHAVF